MKSQSSLWPRSLRSIQTTATLFASVMLLAVAVVLFLIDKSLSLREFLPEVERKSILITQTTVAPIQKALDLGIPLRRLRGTEDYFKDVLDRNEEINSINLSDENNQILYQYTQKKDGNNNNSQTIHTVQIPLKKDTRVLGYLNVGINLVVYENMFSKVTLDLFIILLVSLIFALEVLRFVFHFYIKDPLKNIQNLLKKCGTGDFSHDIKAPSRDEIGVFILDLVKVIRKANTLFYRVKSKMNISSILTESKGLGSGEILENLEKDYTFSIPPHTDTSSNVLYMRLPSFLLTFAESLFLPLAPFYGKLLFIPILGLPKEVAITLPFMSFIVAGLSSQSLFRLFFPSFPQKRALLYGALIYSIGMVGTIFTYNLIDFITWRLLSGLGYGIFFTACQMYIHKTDTAPHPNRDTSAFTDSFCAAILCGTAVGGILADSIGFRGITFCGCFLAFLAIIFTRISMRTLHKQGPFIRSSGLRLGSFWVLLRNKNLMLFSLLMSMPSRIFVSGVLLYALPFYMTSLHYSFSAIGRIFIVYILFLSVFRFLTIKYLNRNSSLLLLIFISTLLTYGSFVIPYLLEHTHWAPSLFMAIFGLSHGIGFTAQINIPHLLINACHRTPDPSATLRFYRFFDLVGFLIGPILIGTLILFVPIPMAILYLSVIGLCLLLVFYFFTYRNVQQIFIKNNF